MHRITSIILDLNGTVINKHSKNIERPLLAAFAKYGIKITRQESQMQTGISKRDHVKQILQQPGVLERFNKKNMSCQEMDAHADNIYAIYEPMQLQALCNPDEIRPLPRVIETLETLKQMGIKIGLTTGFTCNMVQNIFYHSEEKIGQYFDVIIASDHSSIKRGRPFPDGVWSNLIQLGCEHPKGCIKIDDSPAGILEGQSAGCKTCALTRYNSYIGRFVDDIDEVSDKSLVNKLLRESWKYMEKVNPTYICERLDGLVPIIQQIQLIHDFNS